MSRKNWISEWKNISIIIKYEIYFIGKYNFSEVAMLYLV